MNSFIEACKEAARLVVLAVIPVLLTGIDTTKGTIQINQGVILTLALVTLLRFIDRWMHEWGSDNDSEDMRKGITRF